MPSPLAFSGLAARYSDTEFPRLPYLNRVLTRPFPFGTCQVFVVSFSKDFRVADLSALVRYPALWTGGPPGFYGAGQSGSGERLRHRPTFVGWARTLLARE